MSKVELGDETPNLEPLGISSSVCERYGLIEASVKGVGSRIAVPYLESCTKLLTHDGAATWDGEYVPQAGLFGQRNFEPKKKSLILTCHEFEALRIATVIEKHKLGLFHAVALPSDKNLGRLSLAVIVASLKVVADTIYVWNGTMFANPALESFVTALDEAGVEVKALSLARSSSPLDLSDPEIVKCLDLKYTAPWSPANLATAEEIFASNRFFTKTIGFSTGITKLDAFIKGLRKSELTMYVAGTGVGKSTLLRQQVFHLAYREGQRCALGFFEETKEETLKKLACIYFGVTFETLMDDPHALTDAQYQEFLQLEATKNLRFISVPDTGFGGMDIDTLLATVRYLKAKEGIDFVAVDHISIMVSGREASKEGERKDIDILMTKLAMACVILEVGILAVCHLSNPTGTAHEEGGRVLLQHMRGSGALKQLAWCVIAQERNQQADDNRIVLIRVLKNRNGGGRTGIATAMEFRDPLLVERTDVDLLQLAANMGKEAYSQPRTKNPRGQQAGANVASPFGADKPGRTVKFGKLNEESES